MNIATATALFLMGLGFLALATLGTMAAQDVQREHDFYCKMVAEHTYPDYKGIYQDECPKEGN